jgi:hypothetical protein
MLEIDRRHAATLPRFPAVAHGPFAGWSRLASPESQVPPQIIDAKLVTSAFPSGSNDTHAAHNASLRTNIMISRVCTAASPG